MTLLLDYFNPTVKLPPLKNDPKVITKTDNLIFGVSEYDGFCIFVVIKDGKVISGVRHDYTSYPRDEDNQREVRNAAYTAISRAASYLVAFTRKTTERLTHVKELNQLYANLNGVENFTDDRVTARLQEDPRKANKPSDCVSDDFALLSELWHAFPTFDSETLTGRYERVDLSVRTYWGIEKVQYVLSVKGGTYELRATQDVGFEEDVDDIVNNFMADFETPLQCIPVDKLEEGEDE